MKPFGKIKVDKSLISGMYVLLGELEAQVEYKCPLCGEDIEYENQLAFNKFRKLIKKLKYPQKNETKLKRSFLWRIRYALAGIILPHGSHCKNCHKFIPFANQQITNDAYMLSRKIMQLLY